MFVADDLDREREEMEYLSRQAEHFTGSDDRVLIVGYRFQMDLSLPER